MLLLFGLLVGISSHQYERSLDDRSVEQLMSERAHSLGTHLSVMVAFFLETQAPSSAHREVALASTTADLRHLVVLDPEDKVVFSTRFDWVSRAAAETSAAPHLQAIAEARESFSAKTEIVPKGDALVGAFPFPYRVGNEAAEPRSEKLGIVFLEYDLAFPKALRNAEYAQRFRFAGAVLGGLCLLFLLLFHRMLTARVERLASTAKAFASGNLAARSGLSGADELSEVGRAFDEMAGELQRRDAELRESEQRFRQLAENVAEIFWLQDVPSRQFLYVSPAFESIFGRPVEDLLGDPDVWVSAIHPDDRDRVLAAMERRTGGEMNEDYRILLSDGTEKWIRDRSFPIRNGDAAARRLAGIATDVTARKMARQEKQQLERKLQETQRLESLGVLAGGIAHDFNNLLTGMLGNASLARMGLPEQEEAQTYLGEIEALAARAADLCRQMLAYAGKGQFEVQTLDLNHLVQETTQLLQLSIGKNAALHFDLAPGLPALRGDATQLRQIVMNLVMNASEALEGKSGVITVRTSGCEVDSTYLQGAVLSPELPRGEYVCLDVSDNGVGMLPETIARIFEPFYTTKFTGRGLGLSAVLGIVRSHHGALKVYSEPGRGTTFKLLFPRAQGPADPVPPAAAIAHDWRGSGTVLLADDERSVRVVTAKMLEAFGFHVCLATNGREAVEQFEDHRAEIVLVLMDLTMPELDGEQAFRQIRAIDPAARVILMSGFNEQEAVQRFTGKGLAGFLQKPFRPEALRAKLQRVLASRS